MKKLHYSAVKLVYNVLAYDYDSATFSNNNNHKVPSIDDVFHENSKNNAHHKMAHYASLWFLV